MNNQQLSPEKYIKTRARNLPIYKCFVTKNWQNYGMANVVVMRRHVNGNVTAGIYLVDLFCLGIKDTLYIFNKPEEEVLERINIDNAYLEEIDYNLAHNIIYAGHDFAVEFDIQQHKNFSTTKFILEEDNDAIPVIDIPVGDEDGKPNLIVNSSYNYGPVLAKLKKHAGEGNYNFTIAEDELDEEEDWEEDEDDFDEEEDEWGDDQSLDDIEDGFLDFNNVSKIDTVSLKDALEEHSRPLTDGEILKTELLWRKLSDERPELIPQEENLRNAHEFKRYEEKMPQWVESSKENSDEQEKAFQQLKSLNQNKDTRMQEYINLILQYSCDEMIATMIFHGIPVLTLLASIEELEKYFSEFPPAVQLAITAYSIVLRKGSRDEYKSIIEANSVEEPYKHHQNIHAYHHKCFWLVKALDALRQNDRQKILHYHALLRIVGTGGHIRHLYAARLIEWLSEFMRIDEDSVLVPEYEE